MANPNPIGNPPAPHLPNLPQPPVQQPPVQQAATGWTGRRIATVLLTIAAVATVVGIVFIMVMKHASKKKEAAEQANLQKLADELADQSFARRMQMEFDDAEAAARMQQEAEDKALAELINQN